jgi:hypothetical protein
MYVVKRDGDKEEVAFDKITRRIASLCEGLSPEFVDPVKVTQKVVEGVYSGVTTSDIDILAAETCAYMSQLHPDFSTLAARIAVSNLHKNTHADFAEVVRTLHGVTDKAKRPAPLVSDELLEIVNKYGLNSNEFNQMLEETRGNPLFRWRVNKYIVKATDTDKVPIPLEITEDY